MAAISFVRRLGELRELRPQEAVGWRVQQAGQSIEGGRWIWVAIFCARLVTLPLEGSRGRFQRVEARWRESARG